VFRFVPEDFYEAFNSKECCPRCFEADGAATVANAKVLTMGPYIFTYENYIYYNPELDELVLGLPNPYTSCEWYFIGAVDSNDEATEGSEE